MRLFPLLLLSLPLLLLSGLAKANEADGMGPPGWCLNGNTYQKCSDHLPFCYLNIELVLSDIYDPAKIHKPDHKGCRMATGFGCNRIPFFTEIRPEYDCFCDSRINDKCSEERLIKENLTAIAVGMYKVEHSTAPPPTTTPDPNHYCLDGAGKMTCNSSSFCHSKIFLDPASNIKRNETGLGCVEQPPGDAKENGCRKVTPFNIADPIFECFCKSEAGRTCNEESGRDKKWSEESANLLAQEKKVAEKKNEEERKEKSKTEIQNARDESGRKKIYYIIGSCLLALLLLAVAIVVVIGCWRRSKSKKVVITVEPGETEQDEIVRTIAQKAIESFSDVAPAEVMNDWYDTIGKEDKGNVPETELLPSDVLKKDVIRIVGVPLIAATMFDPKFADGKKMHCNFVNDQKTLIASMCPDPSELPHFFLSAVRAGVVCIVQLTGRNEKTIEGGKIMTEYLPPSTTALSFSKGTIGETDISTRVVDVETKPSFMRRCLEVEVKNDETGKSGTHIIEHFHYFDWEDFSLPIERGDIIDFTKRVFKQATLDGKCTLVHCRGGIGRTGAFLVSLIMLKRAFEYNGSKKLTTEEVQGIAKSVRLHRYNAIQAPSQLAFAMYIAGSTLVQLSRLPRQEVDGIKLFNMKCNAAIVDAQVKEKNEKAAKEKARKEAPNKTA